MPTPIYPSWNDKEFDLLKKMTENTALIADYEIGDVASVAGTANQVLVNGGTAAATGNITLSLPSLISGISRISTTGTTTGVTDLLINPTTKASGNLIDAQVNGSSKFSVTSAGAGTFGGNLTVSGTGTSSVAGTLSVLTGDGNGSVQIVAGSTQYKKLSFNNSTGISGGFAIPLITHTPAGGSEYTFAGVYGSANTDTYFYLGNSYGSQAVTIYPNGNTAISGILTLPSDGTSISSGSWPRFNFETNGATNLYSGSTTGASTIQFNFVNRSTTSLFKLYGTGDAALTGNLTVSGTGTSTFAGQLSVSNTSSPRINFSDQGVRDWYVGAQTGSDRLVFGTSVTSSGGHAIRIDSSLNVTIPNGNLTVSGNGLNTFGGTGTTNASILFGASNVANASAGYLSISQRLNYGYALFGYNMTGTSGSDAYTSPKNATGSAGVELIGGSSGITRFIYSTAATTAGNALTVTEAARFSTGNLLLKSDGVDSGNGKLQLATGASDKTSGIGFSSDTSLYRTSAGVLRIDNVSGSNALLALADSGVTKAQFQVFSGDLYIDSNTAGKSIVLRSGNATTALTLDSSQRMLTTGSAAFGGTTFLNATQWTAGSSGFGANGFDKAVIGYLKSGTNGAMIAGHTEYLTNWAPLNIAGSSLTFRTNGELLALTLDSSQNATFSGDIRFSAANTFDIGQTGTRVRAAYIKTLVLTSGAPAAANSTGTAGTVTWDANYLYVCTATDTWKRVAIATWP